MFSDQNTTPRDIHIRNQHQIPSIMDILEYLISKKHFFGHRPPPGGLPRAEVRKFLFEIEQKNRLSVCIRMC